MLPLKVGNINQYNDSSESSTFYDANQIAKASIYDKNFARNLSKANKSKAVGPNTQKHSSKLFRVSRPVDERQNLPAINICLS